MRTFLTLTFFLLTNILAAQTNTFPTTGSVGIGTTSPDHLLQITSTNIPTISIGKINQNTNGKSRLLFLAGDGTAANGFQLDYIKSISVDRLGFIDGGGIETLSILNGGKIGIGTVQPEYKLSINGGIQSFLSESGDDFNLRGARILSSAIHGLNVIASSTNTSKVVWGVIGQATSSYNLANTATAVGVYGEASSPSGSYAGWFNGDLAYSGNLGKPSDSNLKENVRELPRSIELLMKIKPKQFAYKKIDGINFPNGNQAGFIAQEIKEIIPNLVNENGLPLPNLTNEPDSIVTVNKIAKYLTVDYVGLIPYIIKAIQDQQEVINQQNRLIMALIEKDSSMTTANAITSIPYIVSLFPNPAQNQLDIELYSKNQPCTILIYNKDGVVLKNIATEKTSLQISLDNFENGYYLIALSINNTVFDVKRFIVSK